MEDISNPKTNSQIPSGVENPSEAVEQIVGGVPFGLALEKARVRLGYSIEVAAETLRVTPRTLGHIEAGLRTPTQSFVEAVCDAYGLQQDRLGTRGFVPRVEPHLSDDGQVLWLGWLPIQLGDNYSSNDLFQSIAATLRTMRTLSSHQPVYLRSADLPVLVGLVDIEDPDLVRVMISHLRLTLSEAIEQIQAMQAVLNEEDPLSSWRTPEHHDLSQRLGQRILQSA